MIDVTNGATAVLTASASVLAISVLVIVSLRTSDFASIKERLSPGDYDTLYNGAFFSLVSGSLALITSIILLFWGSKCLLITSVIFLGSQVLCIAVPGLRVLWPPKSKRGRNSK
jgi:hypothetical protein